MRQMLLEAWFWLSFLSFGMGLFGFLPATGDMWEMPLWMAICLTLGGGFAFLLFPRNRLKN